MSILKFNKLYIVSGLVIVNSNSTFIVESYKVNAVNSTTAAIGAITVTRKGAQVSMPSLDEAEQFIKDEAHRGDKPLFISNTNNI